MSPSGIGAARDRESPGPWSRLWPRAALLGLTVAVVPRGQPAKAAWPAAPGPCLALEMDRPREREIRGWTTHCYRVRLQSGQALQAVVDQAGIDLVAAVQGPDGQDQVQADGPGVFGPEPLWYVASTSGEHRIEVRGPAADVPAGRYRIHLLARRPATPRDRVLAEALALHARAESRRFAGKAGLEAALGLYESALRLWREADSPLGEARTLFSVGLLCRQRGDTVRAMEHLEAAAARAAAARAPDLEATALETLGDCHRRLGDAPGALALFDRAETLFRGVGNTQAQSWLLASRGHVHLLVGEVQEALDAFRRARELARRHGVKVEEATRLNDVAFMYEELGDLDRAQALYDEALYLFQSAPSAENQAIVLHNVGRLYRERGDPRKALELLGRSLALRRQLGDRYGEGWTVSGMGDALAALGDAPRALEHYRQALGLRRACDDRQGEAATLTRMAVLQARAGETETALASFEQALAIREQIGHPRGQADTRYGMARVLRDRGDLSAALEQVVAAVRIVESLRQRVVSLDLRASFLGSVQEYYQLEIDILMRMRAAGASGRLEARALEASEAARARGLLDLLAEAGADIREGVDPALRVEERALRQRLVSILDRQVRLLAGRPAPEEASQVARDIVALTTSHQAVLARIRASSPRYAGLTQPRILTVPEVRSLLDGETLLVEYALGDERSHAWVVSNRQTWACVLPGRSTIEEAARDLHRRIESPPGQPDTTGPAVDGSLRRLSGLVVAPLFGHLGKRRLVFVADGALHFVPFGLLVDRDRPLVADHEVVNLPSASALALLRQAAASRPAPTKTLAVVADPVFERSDPRVLGGAAPVEGAAVAAGPVAFRRSAVTGAGAGTLRLPRLVFSRREAMGVLALVPERARLGLLDFAASREAVIGPGLAPYRILHFATHGILDDVHPELSGIVLSLVDAQGRDREGFLSAVDVFNLKLNASLLVLSACRSALGKPVRGEGLVSLSRAFMYAGVPTIVASLWQVDDEATAELMRRFYEGMLGRGRLAPAAALRSAQLGLHEEPRWAHPHFWAGFVVQGEWR